MVILFKENIMSQEYTIDFNNITDETMDEAINNGIEEIICLVHEGANTEQIEKKGFRYSGVRDENGEKYKVYRWFKEQKTRFEDMATFFDRRVDDYDEHMRGFDTYESSLESITSYIEKTDDTIMVLDLGCGTGAELSFVFDRSPNALVTCVDVSQGMLEKLQENYSGKDIETICASYTETDYDKNKYDYVVACNTLHHLLLEEKLTLLKDLQRTLNHGGKLLVSDYIVTQDEETDLREKYLSLKKTGAIKEGEYYHIDIPLSLESERKLLEDAGFSDILLVRCGENGVQIIATK